MLNRMPLVARSVAVLAVMWTACSKPVAPVSQGPSAGNAVADEASWDARGTSPQLARDRPIGSPIGFRLVVPMRLDGGRLLLPPQIATYPAFDPSSVFRAPRVAGYWPVPLAGRSYACVAAQDAEARLSPGPGGMDIIAVTDRVDAGGGTPEERRFRRRVLRFDVRAGGIAARGTKAPTTP